MVPECKINDDDSLPGTATSGHLASLGRSQSRSLGPNVSPPSGPVTPILGFGERVMCREICILDIGDCIV